MLPSIEIPESQVWKAAWSHAPIGIAIVDGSGAFRRANPCLLELLGFAESQLTDGGLDLFSLLNPVHRKFASKESGALFAGNADGFAMVCTLAGSDNKANRVVLSARPITRQDGQCVAILCFFLPANSDSNLRLEASGSDAVVRAVVGFRDLWRDNRVSCTIGFIFLVCAIKALDLTLFSQFVHTLKAMITSPTP